MPLPWQCLITLFLLPYVNLVLRVSVIIEMKVEVLIVRHFSACDGQCLNLILQSALLFRVKEKIIYSL